MFESRTICEVNMIVIIDFINSLFYVFANQNNHLRKSGAIIKEDKNIQSHNFTTVFSGSILGLFCA